MLLVAVGHRLASLSRVTPLVLTTGLGGQREVAGIVEVDAHHQTVGSIGGQHEVVVEHEGRTRCVAGHTNPAGGVLPARGTDGIDHHLIPLVERAVLLAAVGAVGTPAPLTVLHLVEGFEEEEVALVLEGLGNLLPRLLQTVLDLLVDDAVGGGRLDVEPIFVVVGVQDDIQAGSLSPFHVLADLSHVVGIDGPVGARLAVAPGHTDAHGAGPRLLQVGVERLCGLCIVPVAPLVGLAVLAGAGVEMVAEVPAPAQFLGQGGGIVVDRLCLGLGLEVQLELRCRSRGVAVGHDGASTHDERVVDTLFEREGNLNARDILRIARSRELRAVEGDVGVGRQFHTGGIGQLEFGRFLGIDLAAFGNRLRLQRHGDTGRRRGIGLRVVAAATGGECSGNAAAHAQS